MSTLSAKQSDTTPEHLALVCDEASISIEAAKSDDAGEGASTLPRFRMVAYTGDAMRIAGWRHPVVVDLQGLHIPSQRRPIRFAHSAYQGIGHTERIASENNTLVAEGVISRDTPAAREVVVSGKRGFPWQASIGASVQQAELVRAGKFVNVNGRQFEGPVYIARKTVLGEISFVDLGADSATSASIAANKQEHASMPVSPDPKMTDNDRRVDAANTAAPDTDVTAAAPENVTAAADDPLQASRREAAAELRRQAKIRQLCGDRHADIAAEAIEEGWTVEKTELTVLRASRPSASASSLAIAGGRSDTTPRVIEAAACLAITDDEDQVLQDYGEQTLEAAYRFRNIGVTGIIRLAAAAEGRYIPAVGASPADILEAAASTMSLPGIMSNIANKSLLAGFNHVENAWRQIAKIGSVRDFKTVTRYRFNADMGFEPIAYGGEFKHGGVSEESYTNKADTYGKMFGIYREDIINDDLDALKEIPFRIGEGAALTINRVFWTLWLSNPNNFFSTAHKNYKTGADTALSVDGLTLARQTFSKQRRPGSSGKADPLGVRPKILLVPASLEILADLLMNSTTLNEATSTPKSNRNPHTNKFQVVASDYLDNEDYAGSSAKTWYLLADPNAIPAIEVVFLNGKQVPTVEKSDMVFNRLGIEFRGYLDFGVKEQDFRGALKMKGEA